jgi:hypothetical protein
MSNSQLIIFRAASGNRAEATVVDSGKGKIGVSVAWQRPQTQADVAEANRIITKHLGLTLKQACWADQGHGPECMQKSREAVQRFADTGDPGVPVKGAEEL